MAEVTHAEFQDAEGVTYKIESERGVISIQESGGHNETHDGDACQGCVDCIETIAIWPQDVPKLIEGLQSALQHAALTGDYNAAAGDEVLGELIDNQPLDPDWREKLQESRRESRQSRCEGDKHVIPHVGCILR